MILIFQFSKGTTVSYVTAEGSIEEPIITLSDDVSSWNVGDQIAIAATDYNQVFLNLCSLFNSHAVGMSVACPYCFEIDFFMKTSP